MSASLFKIAGGTVYDPTNQIDGEVRDIYVRDGQIVAKPGDDGTASTTLNASGLVVMPGGVDMHSHIAGGKVNAARKLTTESRREDTIPGDHSAGTRSGTGGIVPSTFATGYRYAALGYTTAFDAAIAPLQARQAIQELEDTPCIDTGFFLLAGNNEFVLSAIAKDDDEALRAYLGWLVSATSGYAIKLVNPGGVAAWRANTADRLQGFEDRVAGYNITPRDIVRRIAREVNELAIPHPTHIHCNQLGMPGNWQSTLQTMQALEGAAAHLTHIQFHSYGGGGETEAEFCSQVQPLAEYVNASQNITVDVGQVMFDKTISMTADSPTAHYLANLYGSALYSCDVECEAGCGVAPIEYKNKSLVNAWQWAVGLEWFLSVTDPWKIAMSTDHPNGGSFLSYPQIIRLLMDRDYRQTALLRVHRKVRDSSLLNEMEREYTLLEIATITRAAPARMLGLNRKGHLGVGADADITIYTPNENKEAMFALPRYVIKGGQIIAEEGQIRRHVQGNLLSADVEYDVGYDPKIADWIRERYSIEFENYVTK